MRVALSLKMSPRNPFFSLQIVENKDEKTVIDFLTRRLIKTTADKLKFI